MLSKLTIQNAALISYAELNFSAGLNVLSGETGAGKSVILDCIDFVLGAKADKELVRTGEKECRVTAEFTCEDSRVIAALEELDIEPEEILVLSRKLTVDGKSSIKLNGNTVTASMLRRVTAYLVDIHGQSEHFFLLKERNQLALLDGIAGLPVQKEKAVLSDLLQKRKSLLSEMEKLGGDEGERARRIDILAFQIEEIEKIAPKEGEEEELTALLTRFSNLEKILGGLSGAKEAIGMDGGAADSVNGARRVLTQISRYDEKYATLAERLGGVSAELDDVVGIIEAYASELDIDEGEVERAQARIAELRKLKKKYGNDVPEILAFLENAKREYDGLTKSGERIAELADELNRTEDALYEGAVRLQKARKNAADGFTKRVTEELKTLNILSARFEISFGEFTREDAPKTTSEGLGSVQFLFSANAGEPPKELEKIISGGEMSRFMLAVKTQLSGTDDGAGTYLFDEIDAGISGKTARVVAEKFSKIARHAQILAVTHSAQIAAAADISFLIEKSEEGGRTQTTIRTIEGQERVKEIARLIGEADSEYAKKHAEELIAHAFDYKRTIK